MSIARRASRTWRGAGMGDMRMMLMGAMGLALGALLACGSGEEGDAPHGHAGGAGASAGAAGSDAGGGGSDAGGGGSDAGGGGSAGTTTADAGDSGPIADAGDASAGASGTAGSGGESGAAGADAGHEPDGWGPMTYAGMYAGIESLSGDALRDKLCQLVKQNHQSMSYTAARQVVLWKTDNHSGQVQGIYDGFWHDPNHTAINIEHTWPQSKGADTLPARSDLHHLFPVQANFNSARSNLTFGEVVQRTWPSTLTGDASCMDAMPGNVDGCYSIKGMDAYNVVVFEPRDGHKGDSARAVFYFSIRYGLNCQPKSLQVFDPQHAAVTEAVLKKWNRHDPPSDHERQRNDVIEAEQGTRNPFVDHPELVDAISFL
jgi:deoxyribonuclease I